MEYREIISSTNHYPAIISLDSEYSELNLRKATLLSISISPSENLTYIFRPPYLHLALDYIKMASIVFTWNGVVDHYIIQKTFGLEFKSKIIDGMLMEHLIDERLPHGLGDYALREQGDGYKSEFWRKYKSYQEAPLDEQNEYEMRDGCYTFRAGTKYLESLTSKLDLVTHVHRLQWALFDTEMEGLCVDVDLIKDTKRVMGAKIESYLPKLREEFESECNLWEMRKWNETISSYKTEASKLKAPRPKFNFASGTQIQWLVYDCLNLPVLERTKKGAPSTNFETLQQLAVDNPILNTLVSYKDEKTLYSTFVEGMLDRVEDSRIYPHFNCNGTATGRISHSNPNMGNIPREGPIRNFFIPSDGMVLIGSDFSQLEVIVEANLTEDKQLLKIILEGASKHDITATGIGIHRDKAKTLNFACQYGAGTHKISKILDISYRDAEDIFNRYWLLYGGVKALKDQTAREVARKGFVTTLFGRSRHFDTPKNEFDKARIERMAYNHLIQGTGADITNRASYLISEKFKESQVGRFLFSVHDEVIAEVRKDDLEIGQKIIQDCMLEPSSYLKLKYPIQSKSYGPILCWSKT